MLSAVAASVLLPVAASGVGTALPPRYAAIALTDQQNLRLAAYQIQEQALAAGALKQPVPSSRPAVVLFESVDAVLHSARAAGIASRVTDTRALMGAVPVNLARRLAHRP